MKQNNEANWSILLIIISLSLSVNGLAQEFIIEQTEEGVWITEGELPILHYQAEPKSKNGKYERANYIHPLYGLHGEILTEDFPEDHLHHRGIFWAWHQMRVDGKQVADGWAIDNMTWDVTEIETNAKKKQATMEMEVIWKTLSGEKEPLVRENTTITIWPTRENSRTIDFSISLTALVKNLEIGGSEDEKGYSGFSLRVKLPGDLTFTSEGKEITPEKTAVEGGPWLDMTGTFDSAHPASGIAVFCHPDYPLQEQPWILRYKGSMQNPAFPHTERVSISRRKPLVLKYRVVIHDMTVDQETLAEMYDYYIHE